MAQKGQKQEGMSCAEVLAVCGFHTQGYCTISPHTYIVLVSTCRDPYRNRHRVFESTVWTAHRQLLVQMVAQDLPHL